MKIVVTAKEAMDKDVWQKLCDMKGLNPWCVNEGANQDMEIELTVAEAQVLRFVPEEDDCR